MPLYKRPGSPFWWISLRHRGRRVRRSTETSDRAIAQRQHDELKARLWKEKVSGYQLADALLAWLDERPRSRKDENALALIRREYADRPLIDVTPASVEAALGAGRGPGAYNRYMVIIRSALNIAARKGWIEAAPSFQRRPEPESDETFLSPEDWRTLHDELPPHLQRMFRFASATGLRWDNVALLEWANVDVARAQLTLPARLLKGRKPAPIPLNDAALAVLVAAQGEDPVFVFTYKGAPIGSPKTAFGKARERAGLPHMTWHRATRHSWASWHAQEGTPMEVLQRLGAWASPAMLQRYAHLAPSHVAKYAGNVDTILDTQPRKKRASPR